MPGSGRHSPAWLSLLLLLLVPVVVRGGDARFCTRPRLRSRPSQARVPMAVKDVHLLDLRGGAAPSAAAAATSAPMSRAYAWAILFAATGFELVSTGFMHQAQGFSKPWPSLFAIAFYAASFSFFNLSLRALEISVAYAVWSAVVMAALAFIGMTALGENVSGGKICGIAAIIAGTVLLSMEGVGA